MKFQGYIVFVLMMIVLSSCEKDVSISIPPPEEKIVVEGYIEQDLPPYIFLTMNQSLYDPIDLKKLTSSFVHDAEVKISDGTNTYTLTEISTKDLPQDLVAQILNVDQSDIQGLVFYFYASTQFTGEIGKTYTLTVKKDKHSITAITKIPEPAPLDSFWTVPPADPRLDSLARLYTSYNDPDSLGNFVRYFIQVNQGPMVPAYIYDDQFINGKTIEFELSRPLGRNEQADWDSTGYYGLGDTVIVKWCSIDRPHYRFWETWDFAINSAGNPFGGPAYIESNVNGGLGIWGGYGASYDTIIIK